MQGVNSHVYYIESLNLQGCFASCSGKKSSEMVSIGMHKGLVSPKELLYIVCICLNKLYYIYVCKTCFLKYHDIS